MEFVWWRPIKRDKICCLGKLLQSLTGLKELFNVNASHRCEPIELRRKKIHPTLHLNVNNVFIKFHPVRSRIFCVSCCYMSNEHELEHLACPTRLSFVLFMSKRPLINRFKLHVFLYKNKWFSKRLKSAIVVQITISHDQHDLSRQMIFWSRK